MKALWFQVYQSWNLFIAAENSRQFLLFSRSATQNEVLVCLLRLSLCHPHRCCIFVGSISHRFIMNEAINQHTFLRGTYIHDGVCMYINETKVFVGYSRKKVVRESLSPCIWIKHFKICAFVSFFKNLRVQCNDKIGNFDFDKIEVKLCELSFV